VEWAACRTSRLVGDEKQSDPLSHPKSHETKFSVRVISCEFADHLLVVVNNLLREPASPLVLVGIFIVVVVALPVWIFSMIDIIVHQALDLFEILFKNPGYSIPFLLNLFVFIL
jgi:hypothetical protein